MATSKAKRTIPLAQLQPQRRSPNPTTNSKPSSQPAELMPVKPHVYYAIAELNAGLEKAIHNLQMLQSNQLFGTSGLTGMNHVLRGIRARANRQFMMSLNERESANALHFERLCSQQGKETGDHSAGG